MESLSRWPPSAPYREGMALGRGKTEHDGPRDMSRKAGHWGFTEEAKAWASRAPRRDERAELAAELSQHTKADD